MHKAEQETQGVRPRLIAIGAALASLRHPRRSLSGKLMLVVMLTTTMALSVAGAGLLLTDLHDSRKVWADDVATEAGILALATAPALSFDNRDGAARSLAALEIRTSIRVAALYGTDGKLFAHYIAAGEPAPPARRDSSGAGVRIVNNQVELVRSIFQSGEKLGTLYLRARYDVGGRMRAYAGVLATVFIFSLAVALILCAWLQHVITKPMDAMTRVARNIVGRRDYTLRAPKTTQDEIGLVVDAFNNMLDEVQSRSRAREEADRRKDEFLATLAHELRNPLAPIRNAVQVLDLPNADERQRRWGREVIARQVRNMALLLDDLLDVSRITRGQLELKKQTVELQSVIDVAIETARPLLEAKRHNLETHVPEQPLSVEADPLRLSQVLANLLTNAAKYTDAQGTIALTATLSDAGLLLSVKDNGIGLRSESIQSLFTMFSQVNSAIDRAEGGLGIGLALVKGLVTLHGGEVEARSDGLGRGSEFIVTLPRSSVVSQASLPEAVQSTHDETVSGANIRVLVADDNEDGAMTLAIVLKLSGYGVTTAFSGPEAFAAVARERPAVALLDIGMPGLSGYEVAQKIRAESWGGALVLIALTGWGQAEDKQKAKDAGFDAHLTKPVDPVEVERLVASLLQKREHTQ